jgi:hypothetical protein
MPCPHGMPGTRYAVHRQTSSLRGVTFQGIPIRALEFYEGLEADNSRTYWTRHRAVYDDCVRAPLQAIADTLEAEFGTPKLFRPHRDVRFSADNSGVVDGRVALRCGSPGGAGGGWSGTVARGQVRRGMAMTLAKVVTASVTQGQDAGSRRCRRRALVVRRAGTCRNRYRSALGSQAFSRRVGRAAVARR